MINAKEKGAENERKKGAIPHNIWRPDILQHGARGAPDRLYKAGDYESKRWERRFFDRALSEACVPGRDADDGLAYNGA